MTRPLFSIIMPVYNRQELVRRAIDSCLTQEFTDFEIIAADDGSTDSSCEVIASYEDPRVRLVGFERNHGRCPARNLAMEHARGSWFVFLDSDDELVPGALGVMRGCIERAEKSVGAVRFMCRTIDGELSPDPPHDGSVCDYRGFIRWMQRSVNGVRQESLPCVRADTFPGVRYPEGHAEEALYHLDVARAVDVQLETEVVRIYHHDATNQVTSFQGARLMEWAPDCARAVTSLLERHGPALEGEAPDIAARCLAERATWEFLSGERADGCRFAIAYGKRTHRWTRVLAMAGLGLAGPRPFLWGKRIGTWIAKWK